MLVVEDDLILRTTIATLLRARGCTVSVAASGDAAIETLSSVDVDFVVSDMDMPGTTDGIALGLWIRKNRPGVSFVLTSGRPAERYSHSFVRLTKPFRLADLLQRIHAV